MCNKASINAKKMSITSNEIFTMQNEKWSYVRIINEQSRFFII